MICCMNLLVQQDLNLLEAFSSIFVEEIFASLSSAIVIKVVYRMSFFGVLFRLSSS